MIQFLDTLWYYTAAITPSLALGLLLSGVVHEFLPESIAERYLGRKGVLPVLYVTIIGIILPVCCFGALPIAVTLRRKGVPLGPILAFLVATPATSITAILVTWRLLGLGFTFCLCLGVIAMGLIIGLIGNFLAYPEAEAIAEECPMCCGNGHAGHSHHQVSIFQRIVSVFSFGFIDIPKHIGIELLAGVALAAAVGSILPVEHVIRGYLFGWRGYLGALLFGLLMFMCATCSVPLVHAFIQQGLNAGAGMVLLLVGPITSYGTILVIRKEFGMKILSVYLGIISMAALILGACFFFVSGG